MAREFHRRLQALSPALQSAALAWTASEDELTAALERAAPDAPLRGITYLLKDLFDVVGLPTRAGSPFLADVRPVTADATLVRRLRERGAALAGKTHLVEFAAGLTGENRTFGDCPHPIFPDRLSGGSSSGSAALVAAGLAPLAIGTDTGGSVRVPAAFCGIFGYRGSPRDEWISDAFPLSAICDTAGWFTAHAADMRTTLAALLGPVAATTRARRGVFLSASDLVPTAPVNAACRSAAARIAAPADAATRDALVHAWRDAIEAYSTVVLHEAHHIHREWLGPQRASYDPSIWQRFTDGGRADPAKLAAAHATFAQVRESFAQFFRTHDFLVLPCAPVPALTKAQCTLETRRAILSFTAPASLGGIPCLTVPVALEDNLTAGLQILAPDANSPVFDWVLRNY